MAVIVIGKHNFNDVVETDKKILIDFYADWCGPCKMMAPVVEEISNEFPDIIVGKVNVDEEGELAELFNISSIPLLCLVKYKKLVDQSLGVTSKEELIKMITK